MSSNDVLELHVCVREDELTSSTVVFDFETDCN